MASRGVEQPPERRAARAPWAVVRAELGALLLLSASLSASYAGGTLLGFVDTAMVGRLGSEALGAVGIGNAVFFSIVLIGGGLVSGADPLVAQAFGAGEPLLARRVFWQGLRLALLLSVPIFALMAIGAALLERVGIDPATARGARAFLLGRALSAVPMLVASAARSYLQAAGVTRPIVSSIVIANVANFVGDVLLIFGDRALVRVGLPPMGLPELGVFGAGLSSTIASIIYLAVMLRGVRAIRVPGPNASRGFDREVVARIARVGAPISGQLLAEIGAFTLATMFAGMMGQPTIAGHHVALSLASFTFTVTLGVGSATSVFVGKAVGRGDTAAARRAGYLGLGAGTAFMGLWALAFAFTPALCARLLTDDPVVLAAAIPLLRIAAIFQIADGVQGVMTAALRGAGDTRFAQLANFVGHYAVGLPIAVVLGFFTDLRARGLWYGLSAGLIVVAVALWARFDRLSRRSLARVA